MFQYRTMRKFLVAIVLVCLYTNALATPENDYLALREAIRVGDSNRVNGYAARLKGHVLEPFATYLQLVMRIKEADPEEIRGFIARNVDSHLADKLRGDWLRALGKNQDWELFLAEYPLLLAQDSEIACYALQARIARGDSSTLMEARRLWLTSAVELPASCDPVFSALVRGDMLFVKDVWVRLRLALEAGNVTLARSLARYLPPPTEFPTRALQQAADNPDAFLDKLPVNLESRVGRELTLFALHRLARTQTQLAANYWKFLQARFSPDDQEYLWGQLALQAARQHEPVAVNWFMKAGAYPLSDLQLAWKVRAALREQNWPVVLKAISAMSESDQNLGAWRYWKARAFKALGKTAQANAILAPLSLEFNYYGQLAGEELGPAIGIPTETYKASDEEIRWINQVPAIRRALILYEIDQRSDAIREWGWALKSMDDKQLLAAAELAKRNNWLDRAISTADKTQRLHDFSLRFPAPHREVMQSHTRRVGLDEAWVYGLIRQESRFVQQAKSTVGASGLMQLMPTTARWVAKKMGMRDFRQHMVNQLNTNVALGTYYLKYVQDQLDGLPVLATAGYNAGPRRAQRWRDVKPLEGAVYAESIPFAETRGYVQKVMSNATYYANRFSGRIASLKEKMGIIPPAGKIIECAPGEDERSPSCE